MVATSQRFINIFSCMFGVPVSVAQIASSPWQALESGTATASKVVNRLASAIGSVVATTIPSANKGNDISAAISSASAPFDILSDVVAGVGDMASALTPTVQSLSGSPTGTLIGYAIEDFVRVSGKFGLIADEDNTRIGRPLCEIRKLGDMEGFVKTMGASVSIEGNRNEQAMINAILDSGAFIE